MDEPVDYAAVAAYLKTTRGLGSIDIPSAYHSNWLDNTAPNSTRLAAAIRFGQTDRSRLDLSRARDDPRKVWYPG